MKLHFYQGLIWFFILTNYTHSFLLEVRQSFKKCFKAEQSPDKTLEVRFGFPRTEKQNCDVLFSVDLINEEKERTKIYHDMLKCHQLSPGQSTVVKHTSDQYSMEGYYQICAQVAHNPNQFILIQIFIGQKLNPLLYGDGDDVLPLIEAEQLINLDLTIQNIRKSLGWSRQLLTQSKQLGDKLQADLGELNEFTVNLTIFQIVFLILYSITWVFFMNSLKIN